MKKRLIIFASAVLAVALLAAAYLAADYALPLAGVKVTENIEYAPTIGARANARKLDLYQQKYQLPFQKSRPLIIWIHGGSWLVGDKSATPARVLPVCGYVAASINYRFSSEQKFPAQIDDVRAAIKYLRENSARFNIDPSRIGVWGLSAGGHLASLSGLNPGGDAAPVQAVCDWCGPTDFLTIASQAAPDNTFRLRDTDGPVAKLLGGLPEDKDVRARAIAASPVNFVNQNSPPFMIVHGDKDNIVPVQQSLELADKLKTAGSECELRLIKGGGHEFTTPDTIMDSVHFFDHILKR